MSPAPAIYEGYEAVYADDNVDIVYIGTPHAFHKKNCLDAIAHGKHVLCEKAFALNAQDAREVFRAARQKGVFVMEAMWTRFFPLVREVKKVLHEDKIIGRVQRVFADFSQDHKLDSLGPESRLKDPALGAGTALNLGVYSVTWGVLGLDGEMGEGAEKPSVKAVQTLRQGVDVASTIVLHYPSDGRQAICTCSSLFKNPSKKFCRIEGTLGHIIISGEYASRPESFTVYLKDANKEGKTSAFEIPGGGFRFEADAVARDIAAGTEESGIMPWAETVRILEIIDEVRKQGSARFPDDEW